MVPTVEDRRGPSRTVEDRSTCAPEHGEMTAMRCSALPPCMVLVGQIGQSPGFNPSTTAHINDRRALLRVAKSMHVCVPDATGGPGKA
jgi:hypothetical protein